MQTNFWFAWPKRKSIVKVSTVSFWQSRNSEQWAYQPKIQIRAVLQTPQHSLAPVGHEHSASQPWSFLPRVQRGSAFLRLRWLANHPKRTASDSYEQLRATVCIVRAPILSEKDLASLQNSRTQCPYRVLSCKRRTLWSWTYSESLIDILASFDRQPSPSYHTGTLRTVEPDLQTPG